MKRNRKNIALLLSVLSALIMCSCGKADETVQADLIVTNIIKSSSDTEDKVENDINDDSELSDISDTESIESNENTNNTEVSIQENYKKIESISLSTYSVSVDIGKSVMPIVTMFPEDVPDKSELWSSSDKNVAAVDNIGNIVGISEGECIVTVKSAVNPDIFAEVKVKVKKASSEITYIQGILIVNKTYSLPSDYDPGINKEAKEAFLQMQSAAAEEGLELFIASGYRSYDYQAGLYKRYTENYGKDEADRFSARAGHSEHQTGLAFDVNTVDSSFAGTDEANWVAAHCYEYGFIVRYPEGKENITGYKYEPWHIRYLGIDTAKAVFESGLTLEEYLDITSEYSE